MMTVSEALAKFRFRMEDPDGEKWDASSLTQIYDIFTEAQLIGINLLIDVKKYEHLRELQDQQSSSMSGGSTTLPSDFFRALWLLGSDGDFYPIFEEPPSATYKNTDYLREDVHTAYGYIHGTKWYLKGYDSAAGSWILGYVKEPSVVVAGDSFALGNHGNNLTIAISTWIAWGLDRQFDRQQEVEQQIMKIFGVNVDGISRNDS
jgi:hypothetical protein